MLYGKYTNNYLITANAKINIVTLLLKAIYYFTNINKILILINYSLIIFAIMN